MDLDLTGRAYVVAGSSRGIGKSIAAQLLSEGARVCLTGRDRNTLNEAIRSLGASENATLYVGDLSQPEHVTAAFVATHKAWGRVDGLVANLGTGAGTPGWQQSDADWERLLRLNFQASTLLAQAAVPYLQSDGGCIVFIASITGVEATPAPLAYSAGKAALINYSKNFARKVAPLGLRVNCVAPGNILFPGGSWEQRLAEDRAAVVQMLEREVPLRRFGTPEEIANVVAFLLSSRSSFITGSCVVVDGGQTRSL